MSQLGINHRYTHLTVPQEPPGPDCALGRAGGAAKPQLVLKENPYDTPNR
jgi:hypothetical protein